jgi:mRNA interferase MazF
VALRPSPPRRWHVYVVEKPGKQRPCVAIQPNEFAEGGLRSTVVLPLTTNLVEGTFPLRVRIQAGVCGLTRDSDVLVDQILAWDNELFRTDLGPLPEALQDDIRRALLEFLDLL